MALLKDQFSLTIQDGFSFYLVVNAAFLNSSLTSTGGVNVDVDATTNNAQTDQNIEDEITIREIAQSLTDNLAISSGEGDAKITYTLSTYNSEFPYTLDGLVVPYFLSVVISSTSPVTELLLAPNSQQFDLYSATFLTLYNQT